MTDQPRREAPLRRYERLPFPRPRRPRDVTPTLDRADEFERQRALAEQYPCEPPPHGCDAAVGERCTAIGCPGVYLTRRPAHLRRLRAAGVAAPSTVGDGTPDPPDRLPTEPIPEQTRNLPDRPTPTAPENRP